MYRGFKQRGGRYAFKHLHGMLNVHAVVIARDGAAQRCRGWSNTHGGIGQFVAGVRPNEANATSIGGRQARIAVSDVTNEVNVG